MVCMPEPSSDSPADRNLAAPERPDGPRSVSDDVVIQRDLSYATRPTGDLLLDFYRPASAAVVPVVLWLHGGGWFTGDRTLCPDLRARAAAAGVAFASIEYRLSSQAIHPAQLHDVRAAIRYLRTHAEHLGIDPDRIGAWGASAGGHLALMAGLTGHIERLPGEELATGDVATDPTDSGPRDISPDTARHGARLQAVATSYAPTDLSVNVNGSGEPASNPGTPEARLLGAAPVDVQDLARSASPLFHVHPHSPPVQLSHGTGDTLITCRQGQALQDALVAHGVDSELYLVDDYRHGFLNPGGRMDVEMAKVMDDGRLDAEGQAAATYSSASSADPAQTTRTEFSFATVDEFFRQHLVTGHRPSTP